jgi:cobyrinic acid a,c-diamide synthase
MLNEDTWLDHNTDLYRKFTSNISMVGILEANLTLQVDSRFDGLSYIINDFTPMETLTLESECAQEIADVDIVRAAAKTQLQLAVVTTTNPEHMALARVPSFYFSY